MESVRFRMQVRRERSLQAHTRPIRVALPTQNNLHSPTLSAQTFTSSAGANHATMRYWTDVTEGRSSSCYAAADALRTIEPDAGYELEDELGCVDGKECAMPISPIFSIMDRYTELRV